MNWLLLKNSLVVAGATTAVSVAVGSIAALWLCGLSAKWRRLWLSLAVVSAALPPFLVTNTWLDLAGQGGVLRNWLPVSIYTIKGTVWILALVLWPLSSIFVLGALQKIQPHQLEADPLLRGWPLIRWLLLPVSRPALAQAAVLTFVLALNNFAVPAILQTKIFPAELWVSFNTTFDYAAALKLCWPLLLTPAVLLIAFGRAVVRWPRVRAGAGSDLIRGRLGPLLFDMAGTVTMIALLLSVAVPLGQLVTSARTWAELGDAFAAGHAAVRNSFVFAALAASTCTGLGCILWRWRAGAVLWVPFLLPGVLLGIGLIYLLNRPGLDWFYQSIFIVLLALTIRYAALGWFGVRGAMGMVDSRLVDFARLNGATRGEMFRYVHWPQMKPELGAVWLVLYLLCLWDVETLVLIVPPGCETLALRTFNLLHYGHNAQVNALCLLLLGLAVLPLLAWELSSISSRLFLHSAPSGQEALRPSGPSQAFSRSILIAMAPILLSGSGCQPGATANGAPVQSRFFSRVVIIGSRGTALGHFNKPRSLAVDVHDNLYVVDMTGRVQKFSSNGVYLTSWQMPETEKGKPKGMCCDRASNIVVVEPHYNRVNHFSPDGKLVAQWGIAGTNSGQLCLPRAAVADSHGDILVCEYTLVDRVQKFSALGKQFRSTFGQSGRGPGEMNRPEGLGIDSQDRIYVADSCNHRIQVFSDEGWFLRSYGQAGSGVGELSYPYDVQVDRAGYQFVVEFGNSRVQIFDPEGKPVEILGGVGAAPGQFSNPWSEALDSAGNLYVADSQNHRVQKFVRR
jgi:ABC-type Fe3+ transport system permease subunit